MDNRDILISGASVAGPALAYWLRRYGFNPTVVEQASTPRPGGQAIDLRGAARDAAERMGLMEEIRRAHTGVRGMALLNSAGKRVAGMSAELLGDSGGAVADIEILRGDLVRILYEATRGDVEYIFDDSIAGLSQGEDGVEVTFMRAAPRRFDLVLGADGLHSNVRALAFGDESRFVRDLGFYVANATIPNHLRLNDWEVMYTEPGRTAGVYPIQPGDMANAFFYFTSPRFDYDRHDIAQQKRLLARAFEGAGWEVPTLLQRVWEAPTFYFDRVSQAHLEHWSRGRIALLGDAAYCPSPASGVGTSLALVGAYVLAGELAAAGGDQRVAFSRYEREMRDYVARGQALAKGAEFGLIPATRAKIWFRDQMWRMLPYLPWRGMIAGGVQKAATAITLRDYQVGAMGNALASGGSR